MNMNSWQRPVPSSIHFRAVVLDELLPWRNQAGRNHRTWALGFVGKTVIVNTTGTGPHLWLPREPWMGAPVLHQRTPLDALLQNVAADLALTIASGPVESWAPTLELVRQWPHRRRWRSRGAGPEMRHVRVTEPPPRTPVEPATETAWTVVQVASSALPAELRLDPIAAWSHLARHLHDQFDAVAPGLIERFVSEDRR
jgi:hypothetical protein